MSALRKQKGVALLVVLILLVMMSALAAKISQQFCRNLQKTHYQVSQQQLRWAMQAQEKVVKDRLQSDASGESNALSPEGDWQQPLETQGEDYTVVSQVYGAQDCFNVNNLLAAEKPAQGQAQTAVPEKPRNERIVEQILTQSGLSQSTAEEVYLQLVDYLDGDTTTAKEGAESDAWAGVVPARQPANQMMRTIAEIKLLPAFPAAAYPKVSKLLCALPDTASKVDVNTLKPEQAALLAALFPEKLTEDDALRLIESRPESGWENMETFSKALEQTFPQLKGVKIDYRWTGNFLLTLSRMPQFGRLDTNIYYMQGYSGHGVTCTHLAGRLIAELLRGDAERFDAFANLPHYPFPGGRTLRVPFTAMGAAYYSLRDRLGV